MKIKFNFIISRLAVRPRLSERVCPPPPQNQPEKNQTRRRIQRSHLQKHLKVQRKRLASRRIFETANDFKVEEPAAWLLELNSRGGQSWVMHPTRNTPGARESLGSTAPSAAPSRPGPAVAPCPGRPTPAPPRGPGGPGLPGRPRAAGEPPLPYPWWRGRCWRRRGRR